MWGVEGRWTGSWMRGGGFKESRVEDGNGDELEAEGRIELKWL